MVPLGEERGMVCLGKDRGHGASGRGERHVVLLGEGRGAFGRGEWRVWVRRSVCCSRSEAT